MNERFYYPPQLSSQLLLFVLLCFCNIPCMMAQPPSPATVFFAPRVATSDSDQGSSEMGWTKGRRGEEWRGLIEVACEM